MKSKSTLVTSIVIIVIIAALIAIIVYASSQKKQKEEALGLALMPFTTCLKDSGALFYGAFWCPHCQEQKALFGSAKDSLPYVECSLENQEQNQTCIDKKIGKYPTWDFNGERVEGVLTLDDLSQRTGCKLPDGAIAQ